MDQIRHFSRHMLSCNLPRQEGRADQGGSFVGIGIASVMILILVILIFVSICKCSISLINFPSNNQQNPTSNSCSREPDTQTHHDLEALPVFVFGEQPPQSTPTLPQSSSSSPPFAFPDKICAICLDDYAHGESIRVLPRCKHMFHKDCIDNWLSSRNSSCPICRDQIIDKNVESTRIDSPNMAENVTGSFTLFPLSNSTIPN
ncbi:hypothetical protein SADUNF_Sadunf05G0083700 [Salix dunnii]|uniref:RING-type domain-containing protein n=1 Tax=Salix dunnii TaxID=1413687 RepID=A0A835K7H7_9ROSI|nr:hypothetical protein SADUNF_Sadunf05G0083700 [Salix dunnii]